MQIDPAIDQDGNPYDGSGSGAAPPPTPAARLSGPVTDPNDPRLSDPSYASDPDVIKFLNDHYGPNGTALNPPYPGATWNAQTQAWNPAPTDTGGGGGSPAAAPTTTNPSPFPTFTPPTPTQQVGVTAPNPYTFTPFSYQDFSAPTLADAQNQPGYQFGLQQGQQALENSAAARGTLRGGGTLKDLFGYTNAAAEQNYGNVFNQDLTQYSTNRDNAFGTWAANNQGNLTAYNTNFGVAKDVNSSANNAAQANYQNAYQNAAGAFNPQFQASTLTFNDAYQRWLAQLNSLTSIATAGAN